jgi:hypothetical protein
MKAVLASIMALLLISASFSVGVHAASHQPSADAHAVTSNEGQGVAAECCGGADREMSGSCVMLSAPAPALGSAILPASVQRPLRPATAALLAESEPDVLCKPPRTLWAPAIRPHDRVQAREITHAAHDLIERTPR